MSDYDPDLEKKLKKRLWQTPDNLVVDSKSDLLIDGAARSANSFFVTCIDEYSKMGRRLSLAHHTHKGAHFDLAKLYGVPCVALIRDPAPAAISLCIYLNERISLDNALNRWILLYEAAERVGALILDFEDVTNDTIASVEKVRSAFPHLLPDTPFDMSIIQEKRQSMTQENGVDLLTKAGAPSKKRDILKAEMQTKLEESTMIDQARALYERLSPLATRMRS